MCNKPREITLRPSTYAYYLKREGQVICERCRSELQENSPAVSRIRATGGGPSTKYNGVGPSTHRILYCVPCARALNIM